MSEAKEPSGLPEEEASGSDLESKDDKVLYSTYAKAVKEKKRLAEERERLSEERKQLEAELIEYRKAKEAEEKAKLESEGRYQEALELERKRTEELQNKFLNLNRQVEDSQKISAFLKACGGNVEEKYWNLIPIERIRMGEDGKVDESSLASVVQDFNDYYGADIVKKPGTGRLPDSAAKGGNVGLTYEEWLKLPAHEMKKRTHEVIQND